jgi:hypothetical protein
VVVVVAVVVAADAGMDAINEKEGSGPGTRLWACLRDSINIR